MYYLLLLLIIPVLWPATAVSMICHLVSGNHSCHGVSVWSSCWRRCVRWRRCCCCRRPSPSTWPHWRKTSASCVLSLTPLTGEGLASRSLCYVCCHAFDRWGLGRDVAVSCVLSLTPLTGEGLASRSLCYMCSLSRLWQVRAWPWGCCVTCALLHLFNRWGLGLEVTVCSLSHLWQVRAWLWGHCVVCSLSYLFDRWGLGLEVTVSCVLPLTPLTGEGLALRSLCHVCSLSHLWQVRAWPWGHCVMCALSQAFLTGEGMASRSLCYVCCES